MKRILNMALFFLLFMPSIINAANNNLIRLATTTSTDSSGLLNKILPSFTTDSGYKVHIIAVGTGKALRLGKDGDVDIVLVHAPNAEDKFIESGYGLKRHPVMYNDFVIVGPKSDPAKLSSATSAKQAFTQIRNTKSLFISRGDDSGTHKKELSIWNMLNIVPSGSWYRESGQGMGRVLQMANELDAYTLADRGTWLAYQDKTLLKVQYEGDPALYNPYGIIAVNPSRYPDINYSGSNTLIEWMTSKNKGQKLIGEFRKAGQQLFTPMAE